MDERLRNQLTGVAIWFVLLILLVGSWQPVHFSPDRSAAQSDKAVPSVPVVVAEPMTIPLPEPAPVRRLPQAQTKAETPVAAKKGAADDSQQTADAPEAGKSAPQAEKPPAKPAETGWLIKVAAYYTLRQANDLVARLNDAGYDATYRIFTTRDGRKLYSVRIGPYASRSEARRIKRLIDRRFRTNAIVERISRENN